MIHSTKSMDGATPLGDVSGLLLPSLPKGQVYSLTDIYIKEAENVAVATIKYLSAPPTLTEAPFDYHWLLELHNEMFGNVWNWAGKTRQVELSIGIKAYLVSTELKNLVDDIAYWHKHKTYDYYELSARIHHRAVQIHPFKNGNGRWSRMLANIYLRQNGLMPIKWQEDLLSKENPKRNQYIIAVKKADNGDYNDWIAMHRITY